MQTKSGMRIYGCGGAGVNIASHFVERINHSGCADIYPSLVDTSRSNLANTKITEEDTYLVEGLDGSGKIRKENHAEIDRAIKQILVKIEPKDFNVVVFGAAGG